MEIHSNDGTFSCEPGEPMGNKHNATVVLRFSSIFDTIKIKTALGVVQEYIDFRNLMIEKI